MSAADEIVSIVDADDNIVDQVPRHVMRARGLTHRVTYIFVFDRDGRVFLQQRTREKDLYPGYYDAAAGGVVVVGECYEGSAIREAEEELGIRGVPLKAHFKMFFEQDNNSCWGMVYSCIYDGPFTLQPEEVANGEFVPVEKILSGEISPITPDTKAALEHYLQQVGTPAGRQSSSNVTRS